MIGLPPDASGAIGTGAGHFGAASPDDPNAEPELPDAADDTEDDT